MVYLNDILINLNKEFIDYFEWNEEDSIEYVKKVPIIKVSIKDLHNFTSDKIVFEDSLIDIYKDKYELYENYNNYEELLIVTDSNYSIAISINNKTIDKISSIMPSDNKEIINISSDLSITNFKYRIIKKSKEKSYQTRKEIIIKNKLENELTNLYKTDNINKLSYYYLEYFNKIQTDKDIIYEELMNSLTNINKNHIKLLEICDMCIK